MFIPIKINFLTAIGVLDKYGLPIWRITTYFNLNRAHYVSKACIDNYVTI